MSGGHSRFAPSSAKMHTACPASLLENELELDRPTIWAAEGTAAHKVADRCQREGVHPSLFLGDKIIIDDRAIATEEERDDPIANGQTVFEITVDAEMVQSIEDYLAYVNALPGEHYPEQKVDVSPWTPVPDQRGTMDHAAAAGETLYITDLKYGKGVKVFVYENEQLIMYALGFWNEWGWLYDFKRVVMRIHQPRLDHRDEWEISIEELLAHGERIKGRYAMTLQPDPPYGPTKAGCRFCKAAYRCRALKESIAAVKGLQCDAAFGPVHPAVSLSTEELLEAYKTYPLMAHQYNEIKEQLLKRLVSGDKVPELVLTEGRSSRKWRDESDVIAFLKSKGVSEDIFMDSSLPTVAQMKTRLPKAIMKELDEYVEKRPGAKSIGLIAEGSKPWSNPALSAFSPVADDGLG